MAGRSTRSTRDLSGPRNPSKGKHRWTKHQEDMLAELYEDNEFLYNMKHVNYKKTAMKNLKKAEIARILRISGKPLLSPTVECHLNF